MRLLFRIFLLLFGLGAGLVVGALVMRRVDRAAQALAPQNLARRAGRGVVTARHRLTDALDEARRAAAEREAELRAEHGIAPLVDPQGRGMLDPQGRGTLDPQGRGMLDPQGRGTSAAEGPGLFDSRGRGGADPTRRG